MIRCLIFDFDGTLVPTNDIKRDAFATAAAHIDGGPAAVAAILADSPTADRYAVFDALARRLGSAIMPADLVERYGKICEMQILPLIANGGVSALLEQLAAAELDLHLATATPRPAIDAILAASGIAGLFRSVHGNPQSKTDAIHEILDNGRHDPANVAVIGDGANDRAAAAATGCHFVSVLPDASELYGQSTTGAMAFLADRLMLPALRVTDPV